MTDSQAQPERLYAPEQYTLLEGGSGAAKLADSQVAPLVAAARGYATLTPDTYKKWARDHGISLNTTPGRQLRTDVETGDAMLMPWFKADEVHQQGGPGSFSAIQLRPAQPVVGKDGKPRKYDNLAGQGSVLGLHPATPYEWVRNAKVILLAEGLIKGDSALTGLLRAAGVSDTDLADDTVPDPRGKLRDLLNQVPEKDRVLIVSILGVGNWHYRPEWNVLPIKDSQVWVAFDADTSTNLNVWNQASQLVDYLEGSGDKPRCEVRFVDLSRIVPDAAIRKLGIDDYLADGGQWEKLPDALTELGERPAGKDEGKKGEWRVHPDGRTTQEAVALLDDQGNQVGTRWEDRVPIGGRVIRLETRRRPTDAERTTGKVHKHHEDDPVIAEVELTWRDPVTGADDSAIVRGPSVILGYQPKDWDRKGAHIPPKVSAHPEWPPANGEKWLKAIKQHRLEEVQHTTRWEAMGWVPVENGLPVFIVGDSAVTEQGLVHSHPAIGINDRILHQAQSFGVIAPDDEDNWEEQARQDLAEVIDAYIDGGAWTSVAMAATVVALALRPAVPLRPRTAAYFTGSRRGGKTWTAKTVMAFWQARPGDVGSMLGTASDTVANVEFSVAHTPIWVSDDLAPSADRNQANREEAAVGQLIRSVWNGSGKGRQNADGTARRRHDPQAVLIITAENEPSVSSVGDRIVTLRFGEGALGGTDATNRLMAMQEHSETLSRLTYAFLRWNLRRAARDPQGWPGWVTSVQAELARAQGFAKRRLGDTGDATRHAEIASELMITYSLLMLMAKDLGMDDDFVARFGTNDLAGHLIDQVAAGYLEQKGTTPGQRALQAVRQLLASGQAHVVNIEDPNSPPVSGVKEAALLNRQLGWVTSNGQDRPCGPNIGWYTLDRAGERVLLLNGAVAFNEAQRRYPELIPFGQKQRAAWDSAWQEGLTVPEHTPTGEPRGWRRRTNGKSMQATIRASVGGTSVEGVPIPLSVLLNIDDPDTQVEDAA